MEYTVKKLAKLSGVSVRTLHFYDEIGLLKPAYKRANGYRFYGEKQLLLLQQILFFRELGFELKKIQKVLGKSDFDQLAALHSHRKILEKDLARKKQLIGTIDKTIEHINGTKQMKNEEMFAGLLSKEKQAEYEAYMKNRLGEDHPSISECRNNTKDWSKSDMEKAFRDVDPIYKQLAKFKEEGKDPDSKEVQAVIRKHCEWLRQFWTPNRESYTGLGQGYTSFEWKKWFEKYDPNHPKLAMYMAEAMKVFAECEL